MHIFQVLDSFFNSRRDRPENQANTSQSLLPKTSACPPPALPPPLVISVPLQQSHQDVLVEGITSAPQLKTLAEELQSFQLQKVNIPIKNISLSCAILSLLCTYIPAATVTVLLLQHQLYYYSLASEVIVRISHVLAT